ncbi:MAG: hypothetical protein GX770_03660, partial [Firmicutes bacterium]|nr:hypothetical protein [Bacillota bacterium]
MKGWSGKVLQHKTRILVLLLCIGGAVFAPAVLANQGVLIADELFADYENNQLVARGNVVFTYRDYEVRGEEFYLDLDNERLTVPGWVEVKTEERTVQGKNLAFLLPDEEGTLEEFLMIGEAETGEPIVIKGEKGAIDGADLFCTNSSFTGCDAEEPHYHLTAKRTVYYPEDRIEFYSASYWEGKLKFPAFPKLVFSLQEGENDFDESVFGYNAVDGFFLKMVYRYAFTGDHQGKLLFDLIQGKGVGQGFKHWIPVGTNRELSVSFYHLDHIYTPHHDYQLQTAWHQEIGDLTYNMAGKYYDLGYLEYGLRGNLNYRSDRLPTSFQMETGQSGPTPQYYLYPCRLSISWRPGPRTRLTYRNNLYYREDLTTAEVITKKYQNNFEFMQTWDLFSLQGFQLMVRVKQDYNYSDRYQTQFYHDLPAISFRTPAINLGWPGHYQGNVDYLRLVEIKGEAEKVGTRTDLELARRPLGPSLWQQGGFTLDLANSNRYQLYQVAGDTFERSAVSLGLTGTQRFTPSLTWVNTLSWVQAEGDAPTDEFPRLVTSSHLFRSGGHFSSSWRYNTRLVSGNLSGGYNFSQVENPWYPVQAMLALTPLPDNSIRLNATYNPNIREYTRLYLTGRGRYTSERGNNLYLDADYDFLERRWDTLEVEAELKNQLTPVLQSDLSLRYSFFGDGFERARLGLTYDWHCRELFFGYDVLRQEYIVQCQYKI